MPGCPASSISRRRWLHHSSCGGTIDPDNPEYYWNTLPDEPDAASDYNGAAAPAGDYAAVRSGPAAAPDPFIVAFFCDYYDGDPGGDYPEGTPSAAILRCPMHAPSRMVV